MTRVNGAEPSNVNIFNLVVAEVFRQLYQSFPIPIRITPSELTERLLDADRYRRPDPHSDGDATELTSEGSHYISVARNSISWLTKCGFVIEDKENYVLSPKGFEALAAIPTSLTASEPPRSLGNQLTSAAEKVGECASTAAISNIIGQVIGAAARSFLPSGL